MNISAGTILISNITLHDPNFERVVIFIAEYNADGAMGFVINKPFGRPLNQLQEFRHGIAFPIFSGGPVDAEHLYFVHRQPGLVQGGTFIAGGVYLGGDFKQAVTGINKNNLTGDDIKVFIGYCGWDAGELEAEVAEGSWLISALPVGAVFEPDAASLWPAIYASLSTH